MTRVVVCEGPGWDQGPYRTKGVPEDFVCELPPHEGNHQWKNWKADDQYELVTWPQDEEEK